jgi:hypothetical protein
MGFRPKRHEIFSIIVGMLFCCLFSDIICRLCREQFNSPKTFKYYRLLHFEEHRHGNFSLNRLLIFRIDNKSYYPNKTVPRIHLGQPKRKEINLRF